MGGARECGFGALLVAAMVVACGDVTRNDKSDSGGVGAADSSSGTGAGADAVGGAAAGGAGVSSSGTGGDLFPVGSSSSGPPPGPDGCVDQLTCFEVFNGGDPSGLCVGGQGKALFDAAWKCICLGPCATACASTICQGLGTDEDEPCYACMTKDGEDGCWQELEACFAS